MPLSKMHASALTNIFPTPTAIAASGIAVALFAIGPATVNSKIFDLSSHLVLIPYKAKADARSRI